jgi:hypothetical protein
MERSLYPMKITETSILFINNTDAYQDCGFKSRRGHGCLSLVSVVCCQVEVFATSWSLVQRSPTERGVSTMCDREASKNEAA